MRDAPCRTGNTESMCDGRMHSRPGSGPFFSPAALKCNVCGRAVNVSCALFVRVLQFFFLSHERCSFAQHFEVILSCLRKKIRLSYLVQKLDVSTHGSRKGNIIWLDHPGVDH